MKIRFLFSTVYARIYLSYLNKDRLNNSDHIDFLQRCQLSDYSLLEGILALDLPIVHNVRFFGPHTKRHFNEGSDRSWFLADHSKDGCSTKKLDRNNNAEVLSYVTCKLFPSIGTRSLCIYSKYRSNFARILQQSKLKSTDTEDSSRNSIPHEYIAFLSGLVFCCTHKKDIIVGKVESSTRGMVLEISNRNDVVERIPLNYLTESVESDKNRGDHHCIELLNLLLSIDDQKLSAMMNSRILIKSYVAMFLQTTQEVYELYKYMEDRLVKIALLPAIQTNFDKEDFIDISKFIDEVARAESLFSVYTHDTSYMTMPMYVGDGKFKDTGPTFSNCVESSIYHFLNCLLWNPAKKKYTEVYQIHNGKREMAKISSIFTGEFKSRMTLDEMKRWHEAVEDLHIGKLASRNYSPQVKIQFYHSTYENIFYLNDYMGYKNELRAGIINTIKVIEHLTGRENIYSDQIKRILSDCGWNIRNSRQNVYDIISEFIHDISSSDKKDLNVECESLALGDKHFKQIDMSGSITVSKLVGEKRFVFTLKVQTYHQDLEIQQAESSCIYKSKSSIRFFFKYHLKHTKGITNSLIQALYYKYLVFSDQKYLIYRYINEEDDTKEENKLYKLLWVHKLDATGETAKFLKRLFGYSSDMENKSVQVELACNFLKTFDLNTDNMLAIFIPTITNNIKQFFIKDCILNNYNLERAFRGIFHMTEDVDGLLAIWKKVNRNLPFTSEVTRIKIIASFINAITKDESKLGTKNSEVAAKIMGIFSNFMNLIKKHQLDQEGKKFLWYPIMYLFYTNQTIKEIYDDGYMPSSRIYSRIVECLENADLKALVIDQLLEENLFTMSCGFFCDLEYFITEYPDLVLEKLRPLVCIGNFHFYFYFLFYEKDSSCRINVFTILKKHALDILWHSIVRCSGLNQLLLTIPIDLYRISLTIQFLNQSNTRISEYEYESLIVTILETCQLIESRIQIAHDVSNDQRLLDKIEIILSCVYSILYQLLLQPYLRDNMSDTLNLLEKAKPATYDSKDLYLIERNKKILKSVNYESELILLDSFKKRIDIFKQVSKNIVNVRLRI